MNVLLGKKFLSQQILSGEIQHLPAEDRKAKLAELLREGQPVYVVSKATFQIDVITYVGFKDSNFLFSIGDQSSDTLKIHDLESKLLGNCSQEAQEYYYLSKRSAMYKAQKLCHNKLSDISSELELIAGSPMEAMKEALADAGLPFFREDVKSFYVGISPISDNEKIKVVVERGLRVTVFKQISEDKFEPVTMVDDILQAIVAIKELHSDLVKRSEAL